MSQNYIYKNFGVDEGLPSSEVYDVYQDKEGYMWFATDKGLSRYNGYEFENFTTKDGLPGNTILDFYPQENGQIWCYEHHSQSLFYFNEIFDGFKIYPYNDKLSNHLTSGVFENSIVVKSVVINKKGDLTIGGYGLKGFIKISDEGRVSTYYNKDVTIEPLYNPKEFKYKLGILKKDKVFSALNYNYKSDETLTSFNLEKGTTSRLSVEFLNDDECVFIDYKLGIVSKSGKVTYYESEQYPTGIKRIDNNKFFVGYYSNGAEIRDAFGNIYETFLPNKSVSNFLIDAEGGYWFTTIDDGVFYIKNPKFKILSEYHITSLVKDDKSNLYAGHHNGDITHVKNGQHRVLYNGLNDRPAFVEFNSEKSIVYGASDAILKDYTNNKPPIKIYGSRKLAEETFNPLINVASNGFKIYTNDSITFHNVGLRTEDVCMYNDTVFIATPFGLYIKKGKNIKSHQPSPLLKSRLYDIDIHKNTNAVYMASQGNGVIVYGDSIYNISKENGLTNDIVSEIHIENDSTVWACTNTGLNRIMFKPNKEFNIMTITKDDGLLSNDIDDIEIINDTVWVATKKGLCYFKKEIIKDKETSNVLSLSLKDVAVNNSTIIKDKNRKFHYDENNIDFTLQAISHKNDITYLYRLKEVNKNWTTTTNRDISFPSLKPGSYTFEAKANVLNNPNNHLISYTFKIMPPFWKSWWFYSLCFVFFSALVYLFFRIRVFTYNQDIVRELIRLAIKKLKANESFYKFRSNGEDFKIPTSEIQYINSQGNYLDIFTSKKKYTIRCKIGDFINTTPDALEYLRVHRSYIIRIDQVSSKGKNWVVVNDRKIPVGETYLNQLDRIQF